jgi:hypothetical protein
MTRKEYYDMRMAHLLQKAQELRDAVQQSVEKGDRQIAEILQQEEEETGKKYYNPRLEHLLQRVQKLRDNMK